MCTQSESNVGSACWLECVTGLLQAAQVRKSGFVPEAGREYHPEAQHSSTIFAGTVVKQVRGHPTGPALGPTPASRPKSTQVCKHAQHNVTGLVMSQNLQIATAACAIGSSVPLALGS